MYLLLAEMKRGQARDNSLTNAWLTWRCRVPDTMRKFTPRWKRNSPSRSSMMPPACPRLNQPPERSRATCRTDPQSNRGVNPYPRRTGLSRQPHEARCTRRDSQPPQAVEPGI